jgi:DNA-binding response OmpR family regulator
MVEDDIAMADMYRLGLESRGFDVIVLPDAMVLNDTVDRERPDVLVLDWELPIIRGDEALERLRRVEHGRQLPVFILSNFPGTEAGAIDRVFRAGALAWLEKVNTTPALLARRLIDLVGPPAPN